jgi:membrane associated rhomboid family serine protease
VLGASGAVLAGVGYLLAGNRLSDGVLTRANLGRRGSAALLVGGAIGVTLLTAGPGVAVVAHFTGFVLGAVAGRLGILGAADSPDRPSRV